MHLAKAHCQLALSPCATYAHETDVNSVAVDLRQQQLIDKV